MAINLNNYQALIFDLDGTLVDSSEAIRLVYQDWCKEQNLDLELVLDRGRGARLSDFLPDLAPQLDALQENDKLVALEATITTGIVEIAGAKEFLARITRQNIPWGIATSCTKAVAELRLGLIKVTQPKVFITSELIAFGKPDPEHFVTTANALVTNPADCLVFEDSNNGVTGALAAGCDVVVIGRECNIEHPRIVGRFDDYHQLNLQLLEMC